MTQGNRSSLQSHEQKLETNYVIQGEAILLDGVIAPENLDQKIDASALHESTYLPYQGWSNQLREIHRVIAKTDYTAIEISTPELDDVIRWQDDSNRQDGKIRFSFEFVSSFILDRAVLPALSALALDDSTPESKISVLLCSTF